MTLLEQFEQGSIRALSRIITHVENRNNGYRELLSKLYPQVGHSLRIGLTGPPGAGKSTLVNGLARMFLEQGKKVGIIAVDPTSPFTGGALLGDRVRMNDFPMDGSVYFRSMATRGASGGLAGATDNVAILYDAFGFNITLIETVGVGQVELDIIDTCDSVTVALVPESGDAVQTLKAGLMEIADVFCINKSDRPGAERLAADLKHTLQTRPTVEGQWRIPIIQTEAVTGKNLDKLFGAINEHIEFRQANGQIKSHRRVQLKKKIRSILKYRFEREFIGKSVGEEELEQLADRILAGETNPYRVSDELFERFGRT